METGRVRTAEVWRITDLCIHEWRTYRRMSWQSCSQCPPCPLVVPVWGHHCAERAQNGTHRIRASRLETNLLKSKRFLVSNVQTLDLNLQKRNFLDMHAKQNTWSTYLYWYYLGNLSLNTTQANRWRARRSFAAYFLLHWKNWRKTKFQTCISQSVQTEPIAGTLRRCIRASQAGCCRQERWRLNERVSTELPTNEESRQCQQEREKQASWSLS